MTKTNKHANSTEQDIELLRSINPEEKVPYGMTNDYMFRAVLQKSPDALRGLLSALLHIPEPDIISCQICNPIILGNAIDEKTCILDVRVLLNGNRQINLEMQVGSIENWTDRSLYYLCKMFTDLKEGMNYIQTKPSVHIGILTNSPIRDDAAFYNEYALKNRKTGFEFTGKFALHVLDLSYINKVTDDVKNTSLYQWALLFKSTTWKEMLAMAEQSESIKKAVVTLRQLTDEEKIKLQCEARERYRMDWQSSMYTSFEKGKQAGLDEAAKELQCERKRAEEARQQAEQAQQQAEQARQQAEQARQQAEQARQFILLTQKLISTGRMEDVNKALNDADYRSKLLSEFSSTLCDSASE